MGLKVHLHRPSCCFPNANMTVIRSAGETAVPKCTQGADGTSRSSELVSKFACLGIPLKQLKISTSTVHPISNQKKSVYTTRMTKKVVTFFIRMFVEHSNMAITTANPYVSPNGFQHPNKTHIAGFVNNMLNRAVMAANQDSLFLSAPDMISSNGN
eukprot:PhM_4_TR10019/c0_g1_i2/m.34849